MNQRNLLTDDRHQPEALAPVNLLDEKFNQPIQLDHHFSLIRKLNKNGETRRYGLTILFGDGDAANEIKYELAVTYLGLTPENTLLYKLERRSPVYINELIPELVADQLAYEVGKVFYPLNIETGKDGKFLAIQNLEEIRKRWPAVRAAVTAYFEGDFTTRYLQIMDEKLADDGAIQICLRDDWFIQVYFQAIYKSYTESLRIETQLSFPNLEPMTSGYRTIEQVRERTNHFGAIELEHNGLLEQEENQENTGAYQAKYILHPVSKAIQIIIASWRWSGRKDRDINLKLFTLDEESNDTLATGSSSAAIENLIVLDGNEPRKRNGFWDKWF
jgi:hypothetical protein